MALKRLTTGEMVSLTESLVTVGHPERLAMERISVLAAMLPYLDQVHQGLLASQGNPEAERLAGISGEEKDADALHDGLARGVWHGLEAHKYLVRDARRATAIGRVQDTLFPHALKVVQFSYRETAGQGRLLASRLTDEHRALLASIPVDGGTLLDAVHAWLNAAKTLGTLENERTRLTGEGAVPGSAAKARSQWIRAVNAVRGLMLDVVNTEDAVIERVLQRIADVEAVADRRLQGGGDTETDPASGDTDGELDDDLDGDGDSDTGDADGGGTGDGDDDVDDDVDGDTGQADGDVTGDTPDGEDDPPADGVDAA